MLRSSAVTEVYVRKCKSTMNLRKNIAYSRHLSLETLIARNSWATFEETKVVIPFHTDHFLDVVKSREGTETLSIAELIFATRLRFS